MKKSESYIEYMPLSDLKAAGRNPKEHAESDIRASIERFGFVEPFVLNEATGKLVAGHGRKKVATSLEKEGATPPARVRVTDAGVWLFPVLRGVSFKDEREAEAYLLASNRLVEKGGYDEAMLSQMLREIVASEESLIGTGYDGEMLQRLLDQEFHPLTPDNVERHAHSHGEMGDVRSENHLVKQVPIFMSEEQFGAFTEKVKALGKAWSLDNISAIVIKAIEEA